MCPYCGGEMINGFCYNCGSSGLKLKIKRSNLKNKIKKL